MYSLRPFHETADQQQYNRTFDVKQSSTRTTTRSITEIEHIEPASQERTHRAGGGLGAMLQLWLRVREAQLNKYKHAMAEQGQEPKTSAHETVANAGMTIVCSGAANKVGAPRTTGGR